MGRVFVVESPSRPAEFSRWGAQLDLWFCQKLFDMLEIFQLLLSFVALCCYNALALSARRGGCQGRLYVGLPQPKLLRPGNRAARRLPIPVSVETLCTTPRGTRPEALRSAAWSWQLHCWQTPQQ